MPGRDFFARMTPAFLEHAGSAQENAARQADVERLISKAEYECVQMRRELVGLVALPDAHQPQTRVEVSPVEADVKELPAAAAKAA